MQAIGLHEDLQTIVKRRRVQWYGHVSRSLGLAKTILRKEEEGKADRGRGGKQHQGMDMLGVFQVPEGSGVHGNMEETDCEIICSAPTTLVVKGLMMIMTEA